MEQSGPSSTDARWLVPFAAIIMVGTTTAAGVVLVGTDTPPPKSDSPVAAPSTVVMKEEIRLPRVKWVPSWRDEFNGVGRPSSTWAPVTGGGGWGHKALQFYHPANAVLDGSGTLQITATKGRNGRKCWYGSCRYTSGRVQTEGRFSQTYGRFAARIKFPVGKGIWPAFWLKSVDAGTIGSSSYGEIDVAEINGGSPKLLQAFEHAAKHRFAANMTLPVPLDSRYHTYGVDVTPQSITWWVDGKPYAQLKKYANWPYDDPLFIILNVQVGGGWPGPPDASTRFSAQMSVYWVRVYRMAN